MDFFGQDSLFEFDCPNENGSPLIFRGSKIESNAQESVSQSCSGLASRASGLNQSKQQSKRNTYQDKINAIKTSQSTHVLKELKAESKKQEANKRLTNLPTLNHNKSRLTQIDLLEEKVRELTNNQTKLLELTRAQEDEIKELKLQRVLQPSSKTKRDIDVHSIKTRLKKILIQKLAPIDPVDDFLMVEKTPAQDQIKTFVYEAVDEVFNEMEGQIQGQQNDSFETNTFDVTRKINRDE